MAYEAKLFFKVIKRESHACELDDGRCVCWGEIADLGRVIPRWKFGSDAFYESGRLPIVPMMQSAYHRLRFDDARIRVLDRSRLRTILPESKMGPILIIVMHVYSVSTRFRCRSLKMMV